ncbi:MAG: SRPBCC family protein, partial [Actinomycetota bacterium]
HSCLMSDQTEGVGTTRRIQVGRTTLVERVIDWVEPSTLAYELDGLPPVVRSVTNRWTIEPDEDGRAPGRPAVTVSLTSTIDAGPRPPQQVVARAVGRRLGTASDGLLDGLVAHLAPGRIGGGMVDGAVMA